MKALKFCSLLVITVALYFITSSVHAVYYSIYKQYSPTPLLTNGPSAWEINKVQYPSVILENGLFKMWYSGHNNYYWSIGYAVSLDGINWYKYPLNPILTWNDNPLNPKHFITPSVLKDGNTYKMWFTSSFTDHDDGDFTIGYATSSNGISWADINYRQLVPSQNWDNIGLTHPFVVKINGLYYLYYAARKNPNEWTIGLATSTDGLNWTPYFGNPIIQNRTNWWERGHNIGPYVMYDAVNNKYQMWYNTTNLGSITSIAYAESSDGITWNKPAEKNPVLLNEIPNTFDYQGVSRPSLMKIGNTYLMWYAGTSPLNTWNIGLAYFGDPPVAMPTPNGSLFPPDAPTATPIPIPTSTPIPNPTPTLTPSPTPTPTQKPKEPIVVIPGMFASWNKEAILEGKTNISTPWKLLPFVKEYDGIILTLKNLGYTENDLLYVWPYDWRKNVSDNATRLNDYLISNIFSKYPHAKISLIGHSLGGLIARTWAQTNNNKEKLNHIITVGSPNLGTIQPYRAWEGGEVSQDSSALSVATQILLHLENKKLQTDRETIQQQFSVLKDLLPSSPYLIRKADNTEIAKNQMYVWNSWLETLNTSVSTLYPLFYAIGGTGINTPNKYIVSSPNKIDFLLGNWQDGKPVETKTETGDGTVTTARSVFNEDANTILPKAHGALIASKEGIKTILDTLSILYTDQQITEGASTRFTPALLFTIQSPATIGVTINGMTYTDTDGILFIPNATDGQYAVTITGTGIGTYHLSIGQFGNTNTIWTDVTNTTTSGKVDTYTIQFSASSPSETPISNFSISDWFSELDRELLALEQFDRQDVRKMRSDLAIAKRSSEHDVHFVTKIQLEKIYTSLSHFRNNKKDPAIKLSFVPQETIKRIYILLFTNKPNYFQSKHLTATQSSLEKEQERVLTYIEKKKPNFTRILLYQMASESLTIGKESLGKNELAKAAIHFLDAQLLFNEALR